MVIAADSCGVVCRSLGATPSSSAGSHAARAAERRIHHHRVVAVLLEHARKSRLARARGSSPSDAASCRRTAQSRIVVQREHGGTDRSVRLSQPALGQPDR